MKITVTIDRLFMFITENVKYKFRTHLYNIGAIWQNHAKQDRLRYQNLWLLRLIALLKICKANIKSFRPL